QHFGSQFTTGMLSRLAEMLLQRKYDKVSILRCYRPRLIEMPFCFRHKAQKKKHKQEAKAAKAKAKLGEVATDSKPRVWVLDFKGSMDAHEVNSLREEITSVLAAFKPQDQVVLRLESPGGMVHGYGLAASQLQRLRDKNIPLTVTVDKVAASGGYMMACVADKIVSAPFA
ncbi:S49 family peptidase, partial [Klebsiella pneumoniae]|uniref:S49 family peptidase n=1 Tax=Klebsiella pneumoniae TaxID=573 RepID=UPI003EE3A42F